MVHKYLFIYYISALFVFPLVNGADIHSNFVQFTVRIIGVRDSSHVDIVKLVSEIQDARGCCAARRKGNSWLSKCVVLIPIYTENEIAFCTF